MEFIEFIRKLWCLIIFWSCDWKSHVSFFHMWLLYWGYISLVSFFTSIKLFWFSTSPSSVYIIHGVHCRNSDVESKRSWFLLPGTPSVSAPDMCVCMPPLMCMCWVWVVVCCHPVIWWHLQALPMQQCGWHCCSLHRVANLSLFFIFFSPPNIISSLAASLHMCSLHPAVVFIITAVFLFWLYLTALNCCSPGCFSFFFCVSVGWRCEWSFESDVNCSRRCELTTLMRHLHLCCAYLKTRGIFFFLFRKV